TDVDCGYGVLDGEARPTPLFHAKKLCSRHIRPGDWLRFPTGDDGRADLDAVVARGDDGRLSALLLHLRPGTATFPVAGLDGRLRLVAQNRRRHRWLGDRGAVRRHSDSRGLRRRSGNELRPGFD